jgi:hypothetical protein
MGLKNDSQGAQGAFSPLDKWDLQKQPTLKKVKANWHKVPLAFVIS